MYYTIDKVILFDLPAFEKAIEDEIINKYVEKSSIVAVAKLGSIPLAQ